MEERGQKRPRDREGEGEQPEGFPCPYPLLEPPSALDAAAAAGCGTAEGDSDDGDAHAPSDVHAAVALLRNQLYPDPAAAAAAAAAASQSRAAERSRAAPGPSKAAAAVAAAAAAAAAAARGLPPMLLRSQLYTVLDDPTAADRDLDQLRRSGEARVFRLATGADEHVVLLAEDYHAIVDSLATHHSELAQQQQQQQQQRQGQPPPAGAAEGGGESATDHAAVASTLRLFRSQVLPACFETHIPRAQLLQLLLLPPKQPHDHQQQQQPLHGQQRQQQPPPQPAAAQVAGGRAADAERHLLAAELLTRDARAPGTYVFTVPGASAFVKSLAAGRKELLALLSRKRHREALEQELACAKLRGSCLTAAFLLRDLQGRGLVSVVDTTAGRLVRLVQHK